MTKIISTLKAFGHDGIEKESDSILEVLDAVSDGLSRDLFNVPKPLASLAGVKISLISNYSLAKDIV